MSTIQVELTQDERDFLACILYQKVGGPSRGLRTIGEGIFEKLRPVNVQRFDVSTDLVGPLLHPTIVVHEPKAVS